MSVNKLGYLGRKSWAKFAGFISLEPTTFATELPFSWEAGPLEIL